MSLIIQAATFARNAHDGQTRKFTSRPYITHPLRVAGNVALIYGATEVQVAAGWLHDVIEDCRVTTRHLQVAGFPAETIDLVVELTNPSTGMRLPREARKEMDRKHICRAPYWARVIKCLDRIDNLQEIDPCEGFTRLYCEESLLLCRDLAEHSPEPIFGGLIGDIEDEIRRLQYPELLNDLSD